VIPKTKSYDFETHGMLLSHQETAFIELPRDLAHPTYTFDYSLPYSCGFGLYRLSNGWRHKKDLCDDGPGETVP